MTDKQPIIQNISTSGKGNHMQFSIEFSHIDDCIPILRRLFAYHDVPEVNHHNKVRGALITWNMYCFYAAIHANKLTMFISQTKRTVDMTPIEYQQYDHSLDLCRIIFSQLQAVAIKGSFENLEKTI